MQQPWSSLINVTGHIVNDKFSTLFLFFFFGGGGGGVGVLKGKSIGA